LISFAQRFWACEKATPVKNLLNSSVKGVVNLHNNPDVPGSDAQGTLPDTDPIKLPIDPDTNHPE
jgi:hypothetical protein